MTASRVVAVSTFESARLGVVGCTLVALSTNPTILLMGGGDPNLFYLVRVVCYCAYLRGRLPLLDRIASGRRTTLLLSLNVRHVHNVSQNLLVFSCAPSLSYWLSVLRRAYSEAGHRSYALMTLTRFRDTFLLDYSNVSVLLLILCGLLLQLNLLQEVVSLLLDPYVMLADLGSLLGVSC